MDPLSITTSTIAMLQVTAAIVNETHNFYESARDAPTEIRNLVDEINSFRGVLECLQATLKKATESSEPVIVDLAQQDARKRALKRLPALEEMIKPEAPLWTCYNELVGFKDKLTKYESKPKRALKWPFQKREIQPLIDRLRRLSQILGIAIGSDSVQQNLDIQHSIDDVTASIRSTNDDELSRRITAWLSAPDPSSNYNAARDKHHADTGLWLLRSPTYLEWKNQPASLLWLHGKAGSGKTILSSTIIHDLSKKEFHSSRATYLYFYFDFQVRQKQQFESCIRSLLVQLVSRAPKSLKALNQLYTAYDNGLATPSVGSLMEAFRHAVYDVGLVYLIIDSLDECTNRPVLFEGLEDIHRWALMSFHVLVTSRKETDIEDCLTRLVTSQIPLEESVIDSDICSFVRAQIQRDPKLLKWPREIRDEIERTLLEGANGMFRWVVCQLDAIRNCMKTNVLKEKLRTLPQTLDETYERILLNIPKDYVEDVQRVLQCLVCSFAPLDLREAADIVAINPQGEPYYDPDNRFPENRDLLWVCSGLVTTVGSPSCFGIGELRLSHFSVKEYLFSDRIRESPASDFALNENQAHESLAGFCISYLLRCEQEVLDIYGDENGSLRLVLKESLLPGLNICEREIAYTISSLYESAPFAPYAAMFWDRHLCAARLNNGSPLLQKSLCLMLNRVLWRGILELRDHWLRIAMAVRNDDYRRIIHHERHLYDAEVGLPLYYASRLGLDHLINQLLEAGEDINSRGYEGTALVAAAIGGHESTVELLLRKGAALDGRTWATDIRGGIGKVYTKTALHAVLEAGNDRIARILLDAGADANAARQPVTSGDEYGHHENISFNTSLQAAVAMKSTSLVPLLLSRGASLNAPGFEHGSALTCAIRFGTDEGGLVRVLLEAGADPNGGNEPASCLPLGVAVFWRKEQVQKVLVEYGADVDLVKSDGLRSEVHKKDTPDLDEYRLIYDNRDCFDAYVAQTKARLKQIKVRPKELIYPFLPLKESPTAQHI